MTALMDLTNNSAMTTHVYQSNLSALDDFTRMGLLPKDFVFQWKNDVIGRSIVQMERTRMLVCLLNALKIISNAQITNASQMFGFVTEMMIVVITLMKIRTTAQLTNVRNLNSDVVMVVASSMPGSVTTKMIVATERMSRTVIIPNALMVNSHVIIIGVFLKPKFVMVSMNVKTIPLPMKQKNFVKIAM